MDTGKHTLKRLPSLSLDGPDGPIRLKAPELGAPVLLVVPKTALARAQQYIDTLAERQKDLHDWGGRPILVTDQPIAESHLPHAIADADAWDRLVADTGGLIIADRWGVVYFATNTTTFADLPSADDVVDWVRYLGTQCPECGVIDEPGHGEWEV